MPKREARDYVVLIYKHPEEEKNKIWMSKRQDLDLRKFMYEMGLEESDVLQQFDLNYSEWDDSESHPILLIKALDAMDDVAGTLGGAFTTALGQIMLHVWEQARQRS